jgi:hypothetical protein
MELKHVDVKLLQRCLHTALYTVRTVDKLKIIDQNTTMLQPPPEGLLLRHEALPVLLQHPSICGNIALVANLLVSHTAIAAAVDQHLRGAVSLDLGLQTHKDAVQFADWMAAHGHILRSK